MTKPMSMNAVNRANSAIKNLRKLIIELDQYDDRKLILQVNGMINRLLTEVKKGENYGYENRETSGKPEKRA